MIKLNSKIRGLYSRYPFQYRVFFFISAVIVMMTGMLQYFTPSLFQRFIGELDPILCIFLAVIAGLLFHLAHHLGNDSTGGLILKKHKLSRILS